MPSGKTVFDLNITETIYYISSFLLFFLIGSYCSSVFRPDFFSLDIYDRIFLIVYYGAFPTLLIILLNLVMVALYLYFVSPEKLSEKNGLSETYSLSITFSLLMACSIIFYAQFGMFLNLVRSIITPVLLVFITSLIIMAIITALTKLYEKIKTWIRFIKFN